MSTKGAEIVQQLREATNSPSGAGLEAAIQKAGVNVEKVAPFSLLDETTEAQAKEATKGPPDLPAIKDAVAYMNPGQISDFFPSGDNGLVIVLEKREPSAEANDREKKAAFEKRLFNNKIGIVFHEWLRDRQRAANVQFAKT